MFNNFQYIVNSAIKIAISELFCHDLLFFVGVFNKT